jgi:hypothetical protein
MDEVVNVKVTHIRPEYDNLREWIEASNDNLYIGRKGRVFIGKGDNKKVYHYSASIWCNPFNVQEHGREQAIKLYEEYIRERIASDPTLFDLSKLKGKRLGCWCSPDACHGDVLIRLQREGEGLIEKPRRET